MTSVSLPVEEEGGVGLGPEVRGDAGRGGRETELSRVSVLRNFLWRVGDARSVVNGQRGWGRTLLLGGRTGVVRGQ